MVSNYNKKDLEIIYKIQWKNSSGHGDDKANIVGMYDIPATTLNWETFKSYLLKNSGATVDDVRVYYLCEEKEFCIQSQLDFQLALYSFRQKARSGDIINLRLDRISEQSTMSRIKRLRRSAEPRLEEDKVQPVENNVNSVETLPLQNDNPPEWFKKFMKGFKKEIVEEVTTAVIGNLSSTKVQSSAPPCYHSSRKSKMDCCKRPRKVSVIISKPENDHRTLLKSIKMERKLDCKLEKLEQKTNKIKEKKMALALRSNDDESGNNSSTISTKTRPIGVPLSDTELLMDASPIGQHELIIPRMSGGETYHQEWHVINTGDLQWTENTELRYAWGSEALKPLDKAVPCPPLNPNDKGVVSIYLEIPKKAGDYESYWHFYHEGRRFGHWLGCRVIVEPPPLKNSTTPIDILTSDNEQSILLRNWTSTPKKMDEMKEEKEFEPANIDDEHLKKFCSLSIGKELTEDVLEINEINNVSSGLEDLKLYDSITVHDSNSSSDSDNQSIISIADSNSSGHSPSDEFVVVPIMTECLGSEEKTNVEEKSVSSGNLCIPVCTNIKLIKIENLTDKDNDGENNAKTDESHQKDIQIDIEKELGYAFVNIDGRKIAVPKCLLRADYLATAEEAPTPEIAMLSMIPPTATSPTPTIDSLAPTINTSTTPFIILPKEENKDIISLCDSPIGNTEESHVLNENVQQETISSTVTDSNLENGDNSCMSSSRLFMFPSNIPGFEVFPTPKSFAGSLPPESNISCNATNQSSNIFNETIPSSSHPSGQFYQYGYCPSPMTTSSTAENIFGYSYTYPHSHFRVPPHPNTWYTATQHIPPPPLPENPTQIYNKYGAATAACVDYRGIPINSAELPYTVPAAVAFEAENSPPASDAHDISCAGTKSSSPVHSGIPIRSTPVAILPNTLVSGAVNVASSAINTARSVINMFSPPATRQQEHEQWGDSNAWSTNTTTTTTTTVDQDSPRERALRTLYEMGFWDHNLNSTLLARYNNDLTRVISELVN